MDSPNIRIRTATSFWGGLTKVGQRRSDISRRFRRADRQEFTTTRTTGPVAQCTDARRAHRSDEAGRDLDCRAQPAGPPQNSGRKGGDEEKEESQGRGDGRGSGGACRRHSSACRRGGRGRQARRETGRETGRQAGGQGIAGPTGGAFPENRRRQTTTFGRGPSTAAIALPQPEGGARASASCAPRPGCRGAGLVCVPSCII